MSVEVVVVAGALAQRPGRAGHAWVFLHWLLGFRGLGCHVLFVDRMDPGLGDVRAGLTWVRDVMAAAGLSDSWSVLLGDDQAAGVSRADVEALAADAGLLNVMGYLDEPDLLGRFARRIFLDIDPGYGQAWQHAGLAHLFKDHDAYATVGLNVGRPECGVPDLGIEWIPTLPPVDLDVWASATAPTGRLTTIGSWRGPFAPVEVDGVLQGLRVHQARDYSDLPTRVGVPIEMALDIDPADISDRRRLLDGGWRLRDPRRVANTLDNYRAYIHGSLGEFSIAKQAYVGLGTGWFSDRSACYLASGRPVVVSDTGLRDHLPTEEGLMTYSTPEEAADAVVEVLGDPVRHGKAARQLAEDRFDARSVARSLLERVG